MKSRRTAIVVGCVLIAAIVWAAFGLRSVPDGSVGLLESVMRAGRVLDPGVQATLPGLERVHVLSPYERRADVAFRTAEGTRLDLRVEIALRLTGDGARELLSGHDAGVSRAALDAAVEEVVVGAIGESAEEGRIPSLAGQTLERVRVALGRYGEVDGDLLLEFSADSPVNVAFLQAQSRREIAAKMQETGTRILIVGLDGADWQIAEPLIERGLLPNLAALRDRGAWGNIKALTPILSPLLWTSVATGVTADRHGILDFLVRDPDTGEKVPTNSRFRKVRALWNQFSDAGRSVDFVAWWASWPAEPVNGHMISDRVSYSLFDIDMPSGGAGATHPPDYFDEIRPTLIGDDAISYEEVAAFADVTREEFDEARARIAADRESAYREPINHLTKILASTRNYHRIALDLLARGQSDLTAVYYQGIDEVCHRFVHFMPPQLKGIDADDVRRYGDVVERFYAYQDELLGELIAAIAPETTVIILADHGFVNGPDRPEGKTADIEGQPGSWHRPYGVLVLAGPPIERRQLDTTSLLDISPTVLYLAGMPVPDDADGRVVTEAIRPAFAERFETTHVATYDPTPYRFESTIKSEDIAAAEAEMLENLRSLGYIASAADPPGGEAAPSDTDQPRTEATEVVTAHTNLAGVHLAAGELEKAEKEILTALEMAPEYPAARRQLFNLRMRQGRPDEAVEIAVPLMDTPDGGGALFLAQVANAYLQADRAEEGIRRFRAGVELGRWQFGNPLSRLLLETGDAEGAGQAARALLVREPMNEAAMAIAFRSAQELGHLDALQPALEAALEVNDRSVMHLNWLAVIHESRGDVPSAEGYLRRALDADPDHGSSMGNLGAFYARNGRPAEAVPLLERALRIAPNNVKARVNLGSALAYLGRYDEAIVQFEQVVDGGNPSPSIYNALARANNERGDLHAAAEWLRRSLELDPNQDNMRQVLAQLETQL